MANAIYDRTIAFAGICQAVALVQQVAKMGTVILMRLKRRSKRLLVPIQVTRLKFSVTKVSSSSA